MTDSLNKREFEVFDNFLYSQNKKIQLLVRLERMTTIGLISTFYFIGIVERALIFLFIKESLLYLILNNEEYLKKICRNLKEKLNREE